jgi:hypothetical protein
VEGRGSSPLFFGAALSPASSTLRSDGLGWKSKDPARFGGNRLQPKRPPPPAIDERGEDIVDFVFHAQNRAEDIALVRDMGFEVDARLDVQWTNLCTKVVPNEKSFVDIFVHFFPRIFFEATIVNATSNKMLAANAVRTTFGELLRYIGTMLLISCYTKLPEYFWRTASRTGDESEDEENDIPSLMFNRYMSWRRYLTIRSALRFTRSPPPTF